MKPAISLFLSVFLIGGFFFMVSIKPAHAYIEIASVSFFLQMLVAGAFAVLFSLRLYWRNVSGKISRLIAIVRRTKTKPE